MYICMHVTVYAKQLSQMCLQKCMSSAGDYYQLSRWRSKVGYELTISLDRKCWQMHTPRSIHERQSNVMTIVDLRIRVNYLVITLLSTYIIHKCSLATPRRLCSTYSWDD